MQTSQNRDSKRERVKRAILRRDAADIVPWQVNYTGVYKDVFEKSNPGADIDAELENHITLVKYKKNKKIAPGIEEDIFGLKWDQRADDGGDIGMPFDPPLAKGSFDGYAFPEIKKEFAIEQALKLENDETDRFRMYGITFCLYERAWGLRGMEDFLADMLLNEPFVRELMERITEHHLELLDLILPYDFDAVYFGDDWGSQHGLIMGPELWRKLIKPYMKQLCMKVKDSGKMVVLHCCGNIEEILGEFPEIGVDCWNTVQPEIYDLKKLKKDYGKDLCFYGAISNQGFLPYATPAEVEQKCLEVLDIMSGGGYILSPTHNLTPDIPIENARALVKAAKRFSAGCE